MSMKVSMYQFWPWPQTIAHVLTIFLRVLRSAMRKTCPRQWPLFQTEYKDMLGMWHVRNIFKFQ